MSRIQYQKAMTNDDITHCSYERSIRSKKSCSLLLCLFRTSQTAVASIPRLVLSGIREMRFCFLLVLFTPHGNYLLDDLQGSGLVYSDRS